MVEEEHIDHFERAVDCKGIFISSDCRHQRQTEFAEAKETDTPVPGRGKSDPFPSRMVAESSACKGRCDFRELWEAVASPLSSKEDVARAGTASVDRVSCLYFFFPLRFLSRNSLTFCRSIVATASAFQWNVGSETTAISPWRQGFIVKTSGRFSTGLLCRLPVSGQAPGARRVGERVPLQS